MYSGLSKRRPAEGTSLLNHLPNYLLLSTGSGGQERKKLFKSFSWNFRFNSRQAQVQASEFQCYALCFASVTTTATAAVGARHDSQRPASFDSLSCCYFCTGKRLLPQILYFNLNLIAAYS